jgi:hypothetical protein
MRAAEEESEVAAASGARSADFDGIDVLGKVARDADDQEFERVGAGVFEGMDIAELDRDGIAFLDEGGFGAATARPTVPVPEPFIT